MDTFTRYLCVFAVGGLVCLIGQVLVNTTKMTTARILVIFLLAGVVLEAAGLFEPIKQFAGQGIMTPIIGFGSNLAKGAKEGAKEGLLQAFNGGLSAVSGGITAAVVFAFVFAMIFKSHSKKL